MKVSMVRASFAEMCGEISSPFTSPAMRLAKALVSKRVM